MVDCRIAGECTVECGSPEAMGLALVGFVVSEVKARVLVSL